jgi:hypothetical protein
MRISREIFDQQRRPRFGRSNPERMPFAFWEWMIQGDAPRGGQDGSLGEFGVHMRDGKIKSTYGPYRARDLFDISLNREEGPIWTFDRMGTTQNTLDDRRVVYIGGEHEDFYDPDFYIYNDVVILGPHGQTEIYGYPKQVFAPTDFHTATTIGDRIIIVGGLGYVHERRPGYTPVYILDLLNFKISEVVTSGEMPGWVSKHTASYARQEITIRGGQLVQEKNGRQRLLRNFEDYALDVRSWTWRRLTNRNWREFSIRQEKGAFVLDRTPRVEAILPPMCPVVPCEGHEDARIIVAGIPLTLTINVMDTDVVVQGELPTATLARVVEDIRSRTEAAIQSPCILEQL